jgi:Uncharacterized small protein (DUF2292).
MIQELRAITRPSPAENTRAGSLPAGPKAEHGEHACEHEHDVLQAIRNTAFGTIEVTVHQSRIVQITRSEKLRF